KTRQKMLNSAARLLAERGDHGLTIESLISEADVSRGTFYNYWDSREELVNALWDHVGHNPFAAMQAAHNQVEDHAERLSIIARHSIRQAAKDATWGWLVIYIAESEHIFHHELISYPSSELEAAMKAERVRVESFAAARDMIVGTTIAGMRQLLRNKESDNYPECLVALMLRALGLNRRDAKEVVGRPLPPLDI
ncbi:MAG: TetR/AcrR family transcriptional regulator, partial [Haliea sp.]